MYIQTINILTQVYKCIEMLVFADNVYDYICIRKPEYLYISTNYLWNS